MGFLRGTTKELARASANTYRCCLMAYQNVVYWEQDCCESRRTSLAMARRFYSSSPCSADTSDITEEKSHHIRLTCMQEVFLTWRDNRKT